jgi:Flp pilus assembly protein TadD
MDPDHVKARLYLVALLSLEEPKEALSHLHRLHRRAPDDPQVRYWLATLLHSLGGLEQARKVLDEGLASSPDDVNFLLERGLVALDERQFPESERWLRRALSLAPNVPEVHLALSRCLRAAGRAEEATRHLERSRQLEAQQGRNRGPSSQGSQPGSGG